MLGQLLFGLPKRLIEITERRSPVAGNEAGGIQSRRRVAHLLQRRQMNQGLDARHVFQSGGLGSRLGTLGVPRGFIASGDTGVRGETIEHYYCPGTEGSISRWGESGA